MVATRSAPDAGGRRRVVVTGLGVVTPIGCDVDSFWKAALAGASGVRRISHFDAEGLPTRIAAALADPALVEEFRAEAELDAWEPRGTVVGVRAARGAVAAAGAREVLASPRAGVFVGTSGERHDLRELGAIAYASRAADRRVTPSGFIREFARRVAHERAYRTCPQYLAARLAGLFGIEGRRPPSRPRAPRQPRRSGRHTARSAAPPSTSRSRDVDADERPRRDRGDPGRLRTARGAAPRQLDQVHDRPHALGRRGDRARDDDPRRPRPGRPADDQLPCA